MERKEIATLLKVVANLIERMTEKEYRELLSGRGGLAFQPETEVREKAPKPAELNDEKIVELIQDINKLSSREEASSLLMERNLSRNSLGKISGRLKIHVTKSDTKEKLVQKIVESIVGARLRSEAIKDTDLKRTSTKGVD
mgnify:CR=1 FL=1